MAAFVYRDGDDVPRDATRVVIHPSVRALPPNLFSGRSKLKEVRLHEGLEDIGHEAFHNCASLRLLDCPPAVVRIGDRAFAGCFSLEEVRLHEGLEVIGEKAFCGCFALRRLDCPSTVVRIGNRAFLSCWRLSVVELAGIVSVEEGAFSPGFASLGRFGIPPRAIVGRRGGDWRPVADGSVAHTNDEFVLIAPACLTALPRSHLTELGHSIGAVMDRSERTEDDRLGRVRRIVRAEVRREVSAILGLAFWKARIDEAERAGVDAASGRRDNADAVLTREAREGRRGVAGKGREMAQNVLPFLDGLWGKRYGGGCARGS